MHFLARVHRPVLTAALAGLLALAFSTRAAEPSSTPLVAPDSVFDYDRNAPLELEGSSPEIRDGAVVRDISFRGQKETVRAYLVAPAARFESQAGALFVHWLGEAPTTNRTEFLQEAIALASQGIVSLLVDAQWSAPKWYANRIPEDDYEKSIEQIVDLRRAMDVLLAQPRIDAQRIAFIGHDFGAMYGIVMGALDRRPKTYVLMAGTPHFADWFLFAQQPRDLAAYRAELAPIDPIRFVGRLAPASVFFQFAANDDYVTAEAAARYYAAAAPRKQMATYAAKHDLNQPDVVADRIAWLLRELAPHR